MLFRSETRGFGRNRNGDSKSLGEILDDNREVLVVSFARSRKVLRVLATVTHSVRMLRHADGAWIGGALPSHLDSASTLVIACGTGELRTDSGPVHELRGAFRSASLIGCSTNWLPELGASDEVRALVWKMKKTRLSLASAPLRGPSDSYRAGQLLGQQLMTPSLKAMLVMAEGGKTNGSQFLRGLNQVVGEHVNVIGGLSSSIRGSTQHWVLRNGVPSDGCVSAIGLYGTALSIRQSVHNGWTPVGPMRRITRARDCTVFELDGRSAWEVYRAYLGRSASAETAGKLALAIRIGEHDVVRTLRHVDLSNGSIMFAADMPEGATAQLQFGPSEDMVTEAELPLRQDGGIRFTGVGAARCAWGMTWVEGCGAEDGVSGSEQELALALGGEFFRRGAMTEINGGSVTRTWLQEEEV